jgi:hypothetical protein
VHSCAQVAAGAEVPVRFRVGLARHVRMYPTQHEGNMKRQHGLGRLRLISCPWRFLDKTVPPEASPAAEGVDKLLDGKQHYFYQC